MPGRPDALIAAGFDRSRFVDRRRRRRGDDVAENGQTNRTEVRRVDLGGLSRVAEQRMPVTSMHFWILRSLAIDDARVGGLPYRYGRRRRRSGGRLETHTTLAQTIRNGFYRRGTVEALAHGWNASAMIGRVSVELGRRPVLAAAENRCGR